MDEMRWNNVTQARSSYRRGATSAADFPLEAFFEVSARCNIRCEMCAINYDARYQPRSGRPPFFGPELFERMRPIFPTLLRAYLFGLGEPTLNPHLTDYVRELSSHGVEVWFNTNATRIDDDLAEELAIAGADRITVSIDGATAATYEKIRRGATFDSVMRGIRALVRAREKHGRPRVDLSCVAMASNIDELATLVDLCADIGATGVHAEPLYLQPGSAELSEHYERENAGSSGTERAATSFARAAERAKERGVSFQSRLTASSTEFDYVKRRVRADWTCSEPWSSIWVTSAGEVRTCCTNETAFGNVFDSSIEEIWNGAPFKAFRAQHAAREVATGCANCVRNGRVRHSPYFRTLVPVTYEPMFRELPPVSDSDPIRIESPAEQQTVTDPLVVSGRINTSEKLWKYELMIDRTPIANFHASARVTGKHFEMTLPISYVSEGAHMVWARRSGEPTGCAYREVFVWRPTPAS